MSRFLRTLIMFVGAGVLTYLAWRYLGLIPAVIAGLIGLLVTVSR